MGTAAIILAAGLSSRMGRFKPLMEVCGSSAVELSVRSAAEAGCRVYVVTGHNRELLSPVLNLLGAREVFNGRYEEGMFSSVRAGIEAVDASNDIEGALIWPCDCPLIPSGTALKLIEAGSDGRAAVACCAGKRGHPLYIPRSMFDGLLRYGGAGGMKGFLAPYREGMSLVEADTDYVLMDMDTPRSYELLTRRAGDDGGSIAPLFSGKRVWLMRHGETVQHAEKIFMGRCDVPLSPLGRSQAEESGKELARRGCNPAVIYSSGLSRALESARIVSRFTGGEVKALESLAEIDLGVWDGETIRSVERQYPEEYAERGKNLAWYTVEEGENFFDVRRRVKKALKVILNAPGDILIVTHLGVIQSILSLAEGRPLGECLAVREPLKGGFTVIDRQ